MYGGGGKNYLLVCFHAEIYTLDYLKLSRKILIKFQFYAGIDLIPHEYGAHVVMTQIVAQTRHALSAQMEEKIKEKDKGLNQIMNKT